MLTERRAVERPRDDVTHQQALLLDVQILDGSSSGYNKACRAL